MKKLFTLLFLLQICFCCDDNEKPAVTVLYTGGAESITTNSATVAVMADNIEAAVRMGVYYDTDNSFTSGKTANASSINTSVKVNISGLNSGTTYYYRAYAADGRNNILYGETKSFTTEQQNLSLSESTIAVESAGGTLQFSVNCNMEWTVTSNKSWFDLLTTSGSGDGNVSFKVQANTSASERTATITVKAGELTRQVVLTQLGASVSISVSSNSFELGNNGGNYEFSVLSNTDWTVASNRSWCTVSPASGSGNKTVSFNIDANTATASRTATITVSAGSQTLQITVVQAGSAEVVPTLSVSSTSFSLAAVGSTNTFVVTSNRNWTVASNQSWCTVSPASGSNVATVSFILTANTLTSSRTATITVTAGSEIKTISITQAAATETLLVSSASFSQSAEAGNNSFNITSNTNWTVSSNQSWCTVSPVSGSNNGSVTFNIAANVEVSSRIAVITVKSSSQTQQIVVTQLGLSAPEPTLSVSSTSFSLANTASSNTFTITSNQSWTVSSNQSWCTVSPASGSNNGTVTFSTTANTATASRTATITVSAGSQTQQITVFQAEAANISGEYQVPDGVYTIWDSRGWCLGIRIYNGTLCPQWFELAEGECPDRIPSYQWVVEDAGNGLVNITNREFGDNAAVSLKNILVKRESSNIFEKISIPSSNNELLEPLSSGYVAGRLLPVVGKTDGTVKSSSGFRPVNNAYLEDPYIGYKHFNVNSYGISNDSGSEKGMDNNSFRFCYLHNFGEDMNISTEPNLSDTILRVEAYEFSKMKFMLAPSFSTQGYKEEFYGYPYKTDFSSHTIKDEVSGVEYTQVKAPALLRYYYQVKIYDTQNYIVLKGGASDGSDPRNATKYGVAVPQNGRSYKYANIYLRETYFLPKDNVQGEERKSTDPSRRVYYSLLDRIESEQVATLKNLGLEVSDVLYGTDGTTQYSLVTLAVDDNSAFIRANGKTVPSARVSAFSLLKAD